MFKVPAAANWLTAAYKSLVGIPIVGPGLAVAGAAAAIAAGLMNVNKIINTKVPKMNEGTSGTTGASGTSGLSGTSGTSGTAGTSGTLTLSGTTDNGVITLNGSAPNATVESNLTFDGTSLTTNGSRPVVINGTAGNIYIQGDSGGWANGLFFKGNAGTTKGGFGVLGSADAVSYYFIGADNSTPTMAITSGSTGKVGIGITTPSAPLHVYSSTSELARFQYNGAAPYISFYNASSRNGYIQLDSSNGMYLVNETNTPMLFYTNSTEKMRISSAGNVGINNTNPSYKLDVSGTVNATGLIYGNGKEIFNTGDSYLRINQNGAFSSGIWVGPSNIASGDSTYHSLGSNGGTTTSRVYIYGGSYNGTNVINLDGSSGNAYFAGSVGIGNTPSYKLDVNGTIGLASYPFAVHTGNYNAIYEPAGNVAIYLGNASDPTSYYDNTSHWWRGRGNSGTLMFLNSTGLGIGTTSPNGKLHVGSTTYSSINTAYSFGIFGPFNVMYRDSSTDTYLVNNAYFNSSNQWVYTLNGSAAVISLNNSAGTITFSVAGTGTAGGAISWTSPLSVNTSGATVTGALSAGNLSLGSTGDIIYLNTGRSGTASSIVFEGSAGYNDARLSSSNNGGLSTSGAFTVGGNLTVSGTLGIGTASPSYTLDVQGTLRVGTATYSANVLLNNAIGSWGSGLRTYDNGDAEMRIWHENGRGQIILATGYNGNGSTSLPSDGVFIVGDTTASPALKVGIGYTAANVRGGSAKLAVNGNVGIGIISPGSYKLYVNGDTYINGTLTEASSITLKENINPITDALTIISQLKGYTYDRKDGSAKHQAGLIAEEVEQVLPNVVSYDNDNNPSGVQYTKIIAYLVESIKELKQELDSLRK